MDPDQPDLVVITDPAEGPDEISRLHLLPGPLTDSEVASGLRFTSSSREDISTPRAVVLVVGAVTGLK
jgi:hypothetical protein